MLLDSGLPVTVLRPSKVHGQGALNPANGFLLDAFWISVLWSSLPTEAKE